MEHEQEHRVRESGREFAAWDGNWDDLWVQVEEPHRRLNWLLVFSVLAGAIVLGGALAHAYKMFSAPDIADPMLPGSLNRGLSGLKVSNEAPSDPQRIETAETPRMESTLSTTSGNPVPTQPVETVPDLTTVMATPAPRVSRSEVATPKASVQKPINPTPVEATAPTRQAVAATEQAIAPAPPKAEAAPVQVESFVAVLAPQKSRMDALLHFADLQQRYGDVLSATKVNIREINLGSKGIWYRAVVGAPGSREAASDLCKELKRAGYDGCSVIRAR
jgi:hypothetical protein